ncbi:MAG: hypothetical protein K0B37_11875 [Bacteroidales bacterium]|nr:hypothetical protein [Bacteroidales bacterium]
MRTKFLKIAKYLATGIFLVALILNVKFSLTDPFVNVGIDAIGNTTTGTSTGEKIVYCRVVNCVDTWTGTSDANGCITVFGKRYCNFGVNVTVTLTIYGQKENCTGGNEWYDCDACQSDCVPSSTR